MGDRLNSLFLIVFIATMLQTSTSFSAVEYSQPSHFTEVKLGPLPATMLAIVRSPDNRHIAIVAQKDNKTLVVVDGQAGPEYDGILEGNPIFSPDGKRVAYAARKGKKWSVVVDGQAGPQYDGFGKGALIFSPDGKRVAYVAKKGDKWFVVVDGQSGPEYDGILEGGLIFSPDGKRVAYGALKGDKWHVVVDGQAGPEYEGILQGTLIFSPDGKRESYIAKKHCRVVNKWAKNGMWVDKWVAVVDGQAGPEYDEICERPVFSPDGKRVAYGAINRPFGEDEECLAVIDGHPGQKYYRVAGLTFSPDGERMAYRAIKGDKSFVVIDNQAGPNYYMIREGPVFSPDGKRVAYSAVNADVRFFKQFVVVDGQAGPEYESIGIGTIIFSSDGSHISYVAGKGAEGVVAIDDGHGPGLLRILPRENPLTAKISGTKKLVVVDGHPELEYDNIARLTFSTDGKRVAYTAQKGDKWFVVVDGQTGPEYDEIGDPIFNPDGNHITYVAKKSDKMFLVVDGQPGPEYDEIACGPAVSENSGFEAIVYRNNILYRVFWKP